MESPLNKKIQRGENRKAASPKKAAVYTSLHEKVLALVQESNTSVREERRITPRSALTVMDRALESLSSLSIESREAGALREVAVFISTATNTFSTNSTKHTDLLMQGHPLSALNASLTPAEYREKYATWLSADSAINENVRSLVASAHAAEPGSVERDHAFSRLLVTKKFVPGYFKIDVLEAITAAFRDGNSSASRRARVALQWRDRKGRWVEMGRGINFQYRMPDGVIGTVRGTYVGAGSPSRYDAAFGKTLTADTGLVEVRGDWNLPDGLYTITSGNATVFQARIPGEALRKAKIYDDRTGTYKDAYSANIPDAAEIKAGFREAPLGWTKDDNPDEVSFSSDDNYNVLYDDNQYTLFRTDENGKPLDTPVGSAETWGEINALIEKDSPSFDEQQELIESGELPTGDTPIARIPRTRAQIEAQYEIDQARKNNEGRLETNKKLEEVEKLIRTNKDANGNTVPAGWDPVVSSEGTRLSYTRNVGKGDATYPFIAETLDGKYIFGVRETYNLDKNGQTKYYDSWDEVEKAVPELIPYLNRTFAKDNPIEYTPPQASSERKPGIATQDERPYGMELDFGDPEKAAKETGLSPEASNEEIVQAWFEKFIKPAAPSAVLDSTGEGYDGTTAKISAASEKDLLDAFRVYSGQDDATMEDLKDGSTPYAPVQTSERKPGIATQDEFSGSITQQIVKLKASKDPNAKIEGTLDNGIKYTIYKKDGRTNWRGESGVIPDIVTVDLSGRTFDARQAIKREMFRWDATNSVWRRTHLGLGPKEYSDPMAIQATLEKLNGGKKLDGKEAILPSAAEMRQDMETNKWTPEILAYRNGVTVEEINAVLDGGSPDAPSGKEIYERRMAGDSLDKVAKDLGLTRLEVRRLESEYARQNPDAADQARSVQDVNKALDFLDKHMDDKGLAEGPAIGISSVQDIVKEVLDAIQNGDKATALDKLQEAYTIIDTRENVPDGVFPRGPNAGKALDALNDAITRLEADAPQTSERKPGIATQDENQPFDVSVAQKFLDERFAGSDIEIVRTTREGRNSYMILNIPDNELQDFKNSSGFDDFENKDNFTKLPDGTYKLYTDFSELNANLDSPVDTATQDEFTDLTPDQLDRVKSILGNDAFGEQGGFTFMRHDQGVGVYTDEIYVYKGGFEPGDKYIATILDDGGIDWESDALFDENSNSLREAITGANGGGTPPSGKEIYERRIATGDSLDKVAKDLGLTRLEVRRLESEYARSLEGTSAENSISKEAFNDLKNKIAEENKSGYLKSGLYFFHDLIGPNDGALSKDITFMIDDEEEVDPLGTISADGTITWNDPSKEEDWAPALKSALKSFTEGKDKFTKNENTGYMEYDLGNRYVVSYGKDEDGNWFAEMNRFSRDGGLDSENSFPAKSEADARMMAEGLIDRYNDSQEWEDGSGPDEPPTPPTGGEGLGFDETESILDSLYDQGLISLDDRNSMMQGFSDIMQDEERQIGFDDIESAVDDLYENDKITLEERNNIMVKATDLIQDQMPDEDDTYEMTSERKPGKATEGEGGGTGGDEPPTPPSGGGDDSQDANKYKLDFAMDQENYGDIGLDPEEEYTAEEVANAWITTNGLEGKVTFAGAVESNGMWPEMSFNIPDEHKDAFAVAYGYDSWDDLDQDAELDTRQEVSIRVPKDSVTVARDRNDAAVIVRMPDGSWVEYDNEENVSPVSAADRKKLLKDFKGEENIPWRDENGQMFFTEALKKDEGSGPGEPPTPPSGDGDNTPGGGFTDYVVDLASDNSDLDKDLEERLDDDAADVGAELMDQMYDDASRRYELSQDIADNKPEGMSNDEFVRDAVAKMREQLSGIVDSAIDERRSLEDDEELEVDFDKEAFVNAGAKRFEELLREELDNMGGDDEDGDDEPPTPPSGGTPPKTPTPSQPSTPGLFNNFDVPNGAFQLRTVDYEPEGRVDEASTNFTDDPKKLATQFTPQDLVAALSEALVGTSDDAAIAEILNANVDDAGDIPGAEDMGGVDIPRADMGRPSGAGRLEFNAGEEYVPMEALYNAVWEAGLDPNRVVANIYDSVNGNNNNLNRLIEAQGGVRSPEEAQLVDDITAEIRQIKSASPDSVSSANKKDKPLPEEDPLPGQLIENVPIDFENPDYYIPDSNAYIPSQPDVDENGFTDNPEILSRDYETADLIDQMIAGITDGSGAALLSFDDITVEVPVEALRDAIQLQDINTNDILLELKRESNDMSEEPEPAQRTGMPEQISNQKIKDKNGGEFELNLIKIDDMYEGALINKGNGSIQIVARDRDERVVKRALKDAGAHIKQAASGDEAMDDGVIPNLDSVEQPQSPETSTLQAHSQMIKDFIEQTGNTVDDDTADKIRDAINEKGLLDWSEANEEEIIDAIVEVAGPGIFGLENPKPEFPESPEPRRFPPTTGDRQAPEAPANPPAPRGPFGDSEGLNKASALIRSTFSRGFNEDNKIAGIYENSYNGEGMIAVSLGDDADPIIFRWDQRDGATSFTTRQPADWFTDERAIQVGWRAPTDAEQAALRSLVGEVEQPAETITDSADAPRDPSVDDPTLLTPTLVYPGPENRGYHPDNTTLDRTGKVMGKGTRIRASRDGRTGTVIAVQNIDSRSGERLPYVRVRFDDGTVAVRSALKVNATGEAAQGVPQGAPAATPSIATNVGERLDAPVVNPGAVATDGSIAGVSNLGDLPEALQGLGNPDAVQTDFAAWGDRAGEIAFAGRNRVALDNLRKLNVEYSLALFASRNATGDERVSKLEEARVLRERLDLAMADTFGVRQNVTFGNNKYTLQTIGMSSSVTASDEDGISRDNVPMSLQANMSIKDSTGATVGQVRRTMTYVSRGDGTAGYWKVKNDLMMLNGQEKKSGFATAYNRYMEDWYIANGVKEIHVYAAGGGHYQGAFVWALNGFNWETPSSGKSELNSRLSAMRRLAGTDQERAVIDRLLEKTKRAELAAGGVDLDKAPTPMELALVGWYPGAKDWLGKKYMVSRSWEGIKRLDPTAKESVQTINYDQIRRARSRIKDKLNRPDVSREFVLRANSDEFLANNQTLTPYIDEIRNAFQNNASLATLSPAAKTVLSRWVGDQLMAGDSRTLPLSDVFKLRTALDAEAAADNPRASSTDFGVGNFLASASFEDISRNRLPGFEVRRLGTEESGYNDTYLVKHIDSGQSFYVKKDELAKQYRIDPVRAEVEAGVLTRALGFQGMYEIRANTADTAGDVLVMQQAGSSLPLASAPQSLASIFNNGGIQGPDGVIRVIPPRSIAPGAKLLDTLRTPEDAIRITLLDLIMNNQDRHNGNVLFAVDGTDPSRLRMLPIDHSLARMAASDNVNFENILSRDGDNVYTATIPVLLERMGQDALLDAFRNEAAKLVAALKEDSFSPKGNELAAIIKEHGSLTRFREKVEIRVNELLTPGTRTFGQFKDVLTPDYWNEG